MTAVLATLGSLAFVAVLVLVFLRGARLNQAASAPIVASQDEAFQTVGKELGLTYVAGPGCGRLHGEHGGVPVSVVFRSAYYDNWIEIRVPGTKRHATAAKSKFSEARVRVRGDELVVMPRVRNVKGRRMWHWVLDAAELKRWIDDVMSIARQGG